MYTFFWGNRIRRALTVLFVVAVVTLAGVYGPSLVNPPDRCADGVDRSDGECIGIDGSGYDFGTPEIQKVARAIANENNRIVQQKQPYVTVAMMLPLNPDNEGERKQLRSELQGAYLAQYRANREEKAPRLRLVLANPGKDYRQQAKVVDRLARMADDTTDNLRAVTGFNLSLSDTREAIKRLTLDLRIPVLVSRASADELIPQSPQGDAVRSTGLARIIPANGAQAAALASFHGDLKDAETVLVRDIRPKDIYVESLARAFSRKEPGPPGAKDQEFQSPGVNDPGDTANDFSLIGHNICQSPARVVYFAGRPVHLRLFMLKLAEVPCHGKRYTIVSGSGAATLDRYMTPDDWETLKAGSAKEAVVTVQYAAPGHPDAWDRTLDDWAKGFEKRTGRKPAATEQPAHLAEPRAELARLRTLAEEQRAGDIGPVELSDSRTMLVHDGVRTVAEAVFLANSQTPGTVPTRERVAAQWSRLESAHRVTGTSGWICLTNGGNPYDKPVAVVELQPATRKLAFVGLGWPEGRPQPKDCVVPSGTN
ncbi:amino acid ABC transporter substrate-binding protein [Streptomyces sp. NPDC004111]|uniref:amino acid ABC transporter substrate-binding protein n=1 Tax=Streptomyces sp. NPDC004111 TaxID=3364690 RepID=UPI00367F29B0